MGQYGCSSAAIGLEKRQQHDSAFSLLLTVGSVVGSVLHMCEVHNHKLH